MVAGLLIEGDEFSGGVDSAGEKGGEFEARSSHRVTLNPFILIIFLID